MTKEAKKLKPTEEQKAGWSKFFKVLKNAPYIQALAPFLELSSSIFLNWLYLTVDSDKHSEYKSIRSIFGPIIEFYGSIILPMVYNDLDYLLARYFKKMKRICDEE